MPRGFSDIDFAIASCVISETRNLVRTGSLGNISNPCSRRSFLLKLIIDSYFLYSSLYISFCSLSNLNRGSKAVFRGWLLLAPGLPTRAIYIICLLYTSDAADD